LTSYIWTNKNSSILLLLSK